jgi:hypothetical protein
LLFTGDLSGTDNGVVGVFIIVKFVGMRLGRCARISLFLVSGHLVAKGGNILVDLPCHSVFTGSFCERNSGTVLGEVGRLPGRTLQATAGDHHWDRAFLDKIVGGGTK